jgi:dienelactone hydrolase
LPGGELADPGPEETARRGVELAADWNGTPAGIVGFCEGGWRAVELASANTDLVERLVLVSTPIPDGEAAPAVVGAKTLLLYGTKDPAGGNRQATWWKNRLGARIEMRPGAGADILADVWPRVLSHLAPRSVRS